jgi:hypothetical protein
MDADMFCPLAGVEPSLPQFLPTFLCCIVCENVENRCLRNYLIAEASFLVIDSILRFLAGTSQLLLASAVRSGS